MEKIMMTVGAALVAAVGFGYQVSLGTYVPNAGKQVTVPVMLDSSAGLSYASATITYDPQVLVVTKTAPGSLSSLTEGFNPEFDFVATDTNGTLTVSLYGFAQSAAATAGSIASVTFAVREGTAGLYSDLALTDVQLGEKSGVKDVTVGNPLTTQNGMVRVMSASAAVARLENAQTVCADTALASLKLKNGDAIQASDSQTAIVVSGAVTSESAAIPVYGTNNLGDPMKYISQVGFDLTPYLTNDTQGEGVLNITLGTHTFLKVKIEAGTKAEGQVE